MKFLTFITSTLLIVLISQHSITGLPVHDGEESTTLSDSNVSKVMDEKRPTEEKVPSKELDACPPGTERDDNGRCKQLKHTEDTVINTESTTFLADDKHDEDKIKGCKEGFELIDDRCMPIIATTHSDASMSSDSTITVTLPEAITVTDSTLITGKCLEGQTHGEHGICEDIKPLETTVSDDLNLMNCPGGLKRGDDGFCPEINPINRTAPISPKGLLKPDGSCPDNYVKVKEQCLYIKPDSDQSSTDDSDSEKSTLSNINSSDLIPVESGNECPQGYEYYTNGLCRKRLVPSNGDFDANGNRICPSNYDSIDGNCLLKEVKDDSKPTEESVDRHEVPESTPEIGTDEGQTTFATQ